MNASGNNGQEFRFVFLKETRGFEKIRAVPRFASGGSVGDGVQHNQKNARPRRAA